MTTREQSRVFGEVAEDYDAIRSGYPPELRSSLIDYAGSPGRMVEIGAGTGLATALFAPLGTPLTCIEPDPEMAAVLARKVAAEPHITVVVGRFEDWEAPAGGVDIVYCAQAWHWLDPATRFQRAYDALAPGGVLALFGHVYDVADTDVRAALTEVYAREAPDLQANPAIPAQAEEARRQSDFAASFGEAAATVSALWTDPQVTWFERTVGYPTRDYLRLLTTFSGHRMLAPEALRRLCDGIAAVIDARGGTIDNVVRTRLSMARRAG